MSDKPLCIVILKVFQKIVINQKHIKWSIKILLTLSNTTKSSNFLTTSKILFSGCYPIIWLTDQAFNRSKIIHG